MASALAFGRKGVSNSRALSVDRGQHSSLKLSLRRGCRMRVITSGLECQQTPRPDVHTSILEFELELSEPPGLRASATTARDHQPFPDNQERSFQPTPRHSRVVFSANCPRTEHDFARCARRRGHVGIQVPVVVLGGDGHGVQERSEDVLGLDRLAIEGEINGELGVIGVVNLAPISHDAGSVCGAGLKGVDVKIGYAFSGICCRIEVDLSVQIITNKQSNVELMEASILSNDHTRPI